MHRRLTFPLGTDSSPGNQRSCDGCISDDLHHWLLLLMLLLLPPPPPPPQQQQQHHV
jgi:hypothetical protein